MSQEPAGLQVGGQEVEVSGRAWSHVCGSWGAVGPAVSCPVGRSYPCRASAVCSNLKYPSSCPMRACAHLQCACPCTPLHSHTCTAPPPPWKSPLPSTQESRDVGGGQQGSSHLVLPLSLALLPPTGTRKDSEPTDPHCYPPPSLPPTPHLPAKVLDLPLPSLSSCPALVLTQLDPWWTQLGPRGPVARPSRLVAPPWAYHVQGLPFPSS